MALRFYLDHHVPRAIALGLRLRNVDVLTAAEDNAAEMSDAELLARASELGRVLVTFDDDLLVEVERWRRTNRLFAGLVFAHPLRVPIGVCVKNLELIAEAGGPSDVQNTVLFLPF